MTASPPIFDVSRPGGRERRRTMAGGVYPSGHVEIDFVARTFRNTHAVCASTPTSPTTPGRRPNPPWGPAFERAS